MLLVIAVTLVASGYSLWVRRDTWRSRWEAGASLAIALEGCALVLMSPGSAAALGPPLHRIVGLWNVQHLIGHLCLIVAIAAIIYHVLTRFSDEGHIRALFHRQVEVPVKVAVPVAMVLFVVADEEYHADLFPAHVTDIWLGAYWLLFCGLVIYLCGYAMRLLLIARTDPRARATVDLYLISAAFGVAAAAIQVGTAVAGIDVAAPVWVCTCLAIAIFAYASTRSWQAKVAWFTSGDNPPSQTVPPPSA
ncbi:MAG TPA: hypothetical protein VFQ37_05380 [Mycobacterium sp.]|nr:hypothetical protein [Mycobacterium sp.]